MIFVVLAFAALLTVIGYNTYQENQYCKQVCEQFGHSDKGTLLTSKTKHVRDSKEAGGQGLFIKKNKKNEEVSRNLQEQDEIYAARAKLAHPVQLKTDVELTMEDDSSTEEKVQHTVIGLNNEITINPTEAVSAPVETTAEPVVQVPLISLDESSQVEPPWFDPRFDYMAYISLRQAQGLHALPRLSATHRFQVIGCTMDDHFRVAEPIPGVYYQGFVMGPQAVSHNGLAAREELQRFDQQANAFVQLMDGKVLHTGLDAFTEVTQALDQFCARVDQTIAIHLVSHSNISGVELRAAVEETGFKLGEDGALHFDDNNNSRLFSIHTLDNKLSTSPLLDNQAYRGSSMLLDIPYVPADEKTFDKSIGLTAKLSGQLSLGLVNDQMEEVFTQWLKDIHNYVLARREEVLKVGLKPGSKQALRLFF